MKLAAASVLIIIALAWSHFVYFEAGKRMFSPFALKVLIPAGTALLPIGFAVWLGWPR